MNAEAARFTDGLELRDFGDVDAFRQWTFEAGWSYPTAVVNVSVILWKRAETVSRPRFARRHVARTGTKAQDV